MWHIITNIGDEPRKLYPSYGPPRDEHDTMKRKQIKARGETNPNLTGPEPVAFRPRGDGRRVLSCCRYFRQSASGKDTGEAGGRQEQQSGKNMPGGKQRTDTTDDE